MSGTKDACYPFLLICPPQASAASGVGIQCSSRVLGGVAGVSAPVGPFQSQVLENGWLTSREEIIADMGTQKGKSCSSNAASSMLAMRPVDRTESCRYLERSYY